MVKINCRFRETYKTANSKWFFCKWHGSTMKPTECMACEVKQNLKVI